MNMDMEAIESTGDWALPRGMTINACAAEVHRCAVEHGWWEGGSRNVGEILANIHSEVSEAWECWRNKDIEPRLGENGKPEGFESELADIVIRVLDLFAAWEVDAEAAIKLKMDYNEKRPYKHGGKLA